MLPSSTDGADWKSTGDWGVAGTTSNKVADEPADAADETAELLKQIRVNPGDSPQSQSFAEDSAKDKQQTPPTDASVLPDLLFSLKSGAVPVGTLPGSDGGRGLDFAMLPTGAPPSNGKSTPPQEQIRRASLSNASTPLGLQMPQQQQPQPQMQAQPRVQMPQLQQMMQQPPAPAAAGEPHQLYASIDGKLIPVTLSKVGADKQQEGVANAMAMQQQIAALQAQQRAAAGEPPRPTYQQPQKMPPQTGENLNSPQSQQHQQQLLELLGQLQQQQAQQQQVEQKYQQLQALLQLQLQQQQMAMATGQQGTPLANTGVQQLNQPRNPAADLSPQQMEALILQLQQQQQQQQQQPMTPPAAAKASPGQQIPMVVPRGMSVPVPVPLNMLQPQQQLTPQGQPDRPAFKATMTPHAAQWMQQHQGGFQVVQMPAPQQPGRTPKGADAADDDERKMWAANQHVFHGAAELQFQQSRGNNSLTPQTIPSRGSHKTTPKSRKSKDSPSSPDGTKTDVHKNRQEALFERLRDTGVTAPPSGDDGQDSAHPSTRAGGSLAATPLAGYDTMSEAGVVVTETNNESHDKRAEAVLGVGEEPAPEPAVLEFKPSYGKKPCRMFMKSGECRHGDKCLFSHESK